MGSVSYTDAQGRGPSYALWADMPEDLRYDLNKGYFYQEDFMLGGRPSGTLTTAISMPMGSGFQAFGSADSTIINAGEIGGAIQLLTSTNNEGCSIQAGTGGFQISRSHNKLWFEARVKISSIVTNEQSFFVGLCEAVTLSAVIPLTATGALSDNNLVGFHFPEVNTTAFDTSYKANTVTAVEVNSDVGTLAEATYVRLGIKYDPVNTDPTSSNDYLVSFWIDGVKQASTYSVIAAAGTDFPNDVVLYPTLAIMSAVATDETLICDWIQCAQMVP